MHGELHGKKGGAIGGVHFNVVQGGVGVVRVVWLVVTCLVCGGGCILFFWGGDHLFPFEGKQVSVQFGRHVL